MKKLFSLLMSAALACSLAACGGSSSPASSAAPESSPSADAAPSDAQSGQASGYPEKAITVVVPFNAGSNTDTQMRFFQKHLEKALGATLVIENNGGASGTIGTTAFLGQKADGYTVLFSLPTPTVYKPVTGETAYATADLKPAAALSGAPMYLAVKNDSPYTTGADLIDYIKANPGAFNYANAGNGGIAHLAFAAFLHGEGLDAVSVPFTGGTADCYSAVMGGHVQAYVAGEQDLSGRDDVRAIINLGTKSVSDGFDSVPTLSELGYDGYCIDNFSAFYFSKDVPDEIVAAFGAAVANAVNDPDFISAAQSSGFMLDYKDSAALSAQIESTVKSITPVMEALGLITKK